ncbi:MAG: peptidoglycan DD-metalloendopeptidase family protein [Ectothiorhodospiraceae bacterium AqS1]|nr:peptidoglycan DD-metalloendopeptidase family protein [Ectothiorhodospiraceae bacterium AqS1]
MVSLLTIPLLALAAVLLQEDPSALPSPEIGAIYAQAPVEMPPARLSHDDPEIAGLTDPHWTDPHWIVDQDHPLEAADDPLSVAMKSENTASVEALEPSKNDASSPSKELPASAETEVDAPIDEAALSVAMKSENTASVEALDPSKNDAPSSLNESPLPAKTKNELSVEERRILARVEPSDVAPPRPQQQAYQTHEVTIQEGDSLFGIFKRFGISDKELALITEHDSLKKRFKRIRPGQRISLHIDDTSLVQRMVYRTGPIHFLDIKRKGEGFDFEEVEEVPDIVRASASGRIESSFDAARFQAGLPPGATDQVEDILKWDMDFSRDLQPGDSFSLIYEKKMKDGKMIRGGFGPIIALEFINRGKAIRAVRYIDPQGFGGYFTPDGSGMQKAFLRSPVATARISSRFSHARRHPILHTIRPHKGVDYAAPRGTKVMAVGDGKVQFVGRKGNYGKTIILKHHSGYSTLYAHLSKYAKGVHTGARVSQGQAIGFIGSTGLSTGPHLHYEFRINGVHQDPLTIRLPSDAPVPKQYRKDFRKKTGPILTQLDIVSRPSVASSN